MKLFSLLAFLISLPAFASKPVIALHDLTFATGTGIEDIQFLFGGDEEQISGIIDKDAVRKQIQGNMLGVYRCYAANFPDAKKVGKITVKMELKGAKDPTSTVQRSPREVRVIASDFDSKEFGNCVAEHWSRIPMPLATEGTVSEVVMPILARLRATESVSP